MVITVFSVLPLLMARLAVERGDARLADNRRRLLAAATEQTHDLITIADLDGRIEYANSAFCNAVGYPLHEVLSAPTAQFMSLESPFDPAPERLNENGVRQDTIARRRKDGTTFPSSTSLIALVDEGGKTRHTVSVERDITQEKALRDQLIHSERLAAVGQLISGVAHELNNPLQSVMGYAELLLDAERREEPRRDLEHIRSEAARAAKIVRNLLAFVRRSGTERVVVNINELVQTTLALRSYELKLRSIAVEEQYATDAPLVSVNREEIQQVLLNLVVNAEHAMTAAHSAGHLILRTQIIDQNVEIEVQDDGPGVPEALRGRIFEPFFTTKEVGQGTGLGLSIAHGIAESHGGRLQLSSTGAGACFQLVLPLTASSAASTDDPSASDSAASRPRARALVADDEPLQRQLLQRLLVKRGFAVDLAENGQEAIALIDQHSYSIVLCDASMPVMDGLAVHEHLRTAHPSVARSFVFVTSSDLDERVLGPATRYAIPVLSKPLNASKLDAVVNHLIGEPTPVQ